MASRLKILVTGASGFIGSALVAALRAREVEVFVADLAPFPDQSVDGVVGDLRDPDVLATALSCSPETIFHLAARTSVLQSSGAPKVSRSSINFNIAVGTVVPRSVHFVTVPDTLVRIHPAWRGYSYFIVDEEIIIVDSRTLQIVAVLVV